VDCLQLLSGVARWRRISSINVGSKDLTRKPTQPMVDSLTGQGGLPELQMDSGHHVNKPGVCGEMSEQHGQSGRGNESVPQKFVHLVGCHNLSARSEPGVRPRPVPRKR